MSTATTFDPTRYLKPLNGRQYLEVVHRLQWLRAEHPDAIITTTLLHIDWEAGYAVHHAHVEIPGKGIAEGTGSETRQAFPAGWVEKSETVAVGRALAMLGFGTAFALEDFEEGHPADTPMQPSTSAEPTPIRTSASSLASIAQVRLIYLTGTRDAHLSEVEIESQCTEKYGRLPAQLTKAEASAVIDQLKAMKKAR